MKLLIQGNNIVVTEAIDNYVKEKLEKAVKHFQNLITTVDVHLSVSKNHRVSNSHKAEVTVRANGTTIRAQEGSEDLYASIDLVADKIARQLRKYKEKMLDRTHVQPKTGEMVAETPVVDDLIGDRHVELPERVVRTKYFAMPPMTLEEALVQLQLIDHDFFVFRNSETNEINTVYCRNHGGYGVIIPRANGNGNGNSRNGKVPQTRTADKEQHSSAQH